MGKARCNLKMAIFESGFKQIEIAAKIGRSDGWLSKVIHGYVEPNREDRTQIAHILGRSESEIFGGVKSE